MIIKMITAIDVNSYIYIYIDVGSPHSATSRYLEMITDSVTYESHPPMVNSWGLRRETYPMGLWALFAEDAA